MTSHPGAAVVRGKEGFLWAISFRFGSHLANFLLGVVLARLLGPALFGTLAIVMAYIAILNALSDAGLAAGLTQRRHVRPAHLDSVFLWCAATSLLLGALSAGFAPVVAHFYGDPQLGPLIAACSILIFGNGLAAVPMVVLRRRLGFKRIALLRFVATVTGGGLGVAMAVSGYGIWSLVAQQLTISSATLVMAFALSGWRPRYRFASKAIRQLSTFSGAMYFARLLDEVFSRLDVVLFAKLISMEVLGHYQRAKSVNTLVFSYMFQSATEVLFPLLSSMGRNTPRVRNLVQLSLDVICFGTFFLVGSMYLAAEALVGLVYGSAWLPAAGYLRPIALAAFAMPVSAILTTALSARGKSGTFLRAEIAKKAVLALHLAVGYLYGLDVFVSTLAVRGLVAVLVNLHYASTELGVSVAELGRPIAVQLLIGAASLALALTAGSATSGAGTLVALGLHALAYFGLSAGLRTTAFSTTARLGGERLGKAMGLLQRLRRN